jgi:AcrR family transcriptional regulator
LAGLRARQKADRHRRILSAAAQLFRDEGYDRTKIETIAQLAEVSIGTVYNYYQNKGDLLVAIVALDVNEVLNAGEELVAAPPGEVGRAVNALLAVYLDHALVYLNKDMWRNAMAISTRQPDSPFGLAYQDLDERLAAQVCALIKRLQRDGKVRAQVDARAVGEMLFNNTNMMFIIYVKDEAMSLAALKDAIARQNRPLAAAIRA